VDSADLRQSEGMNLIGRTVDGREVPDQVGVVLLAPRKISAPTVARAPGM
jgi:hypothetical protein